MPSVPSLLSQRLLALLTDEWMSMDEFMERAIPLVPPGRALRVYQHNKAKHDRERLERIASGKPEGRPKPEPSDARKIEMGARNIINDILGGARDRKVVEVERGDSRFDRRVRRSREREFAHHCCLHGGTCRGGVEDPVDPVDTEPEEEDDPLVTLIDRVLASRREGPGRSTFALVREVFPGDIDRLLQECG